MDIFHDFSPGLFVMQAVILLVLIFLMRKFAWKPILESLHDREEGIKNALQQAEDARKAIQNLKSDNEKILAEARNERDAILKEARELKDNIITEAKEEAQKEANKIMNKAQQAIQMEKKTAISELKGQLADWSISIAEKMVRKELDSSDKQMQLVSEILEETTLN